MTQILKARAILKVRHDRAIVFNPKLGLWLYEKGEEEEVGNILTDAGRVTLHTFIYGTPAQRSSADLGEDGLNYIGISNDSTSPSAGDTSLAGELSGNGLDRAQGVVTLPVGSEVITTVQHAFTYVGGSPQGVRKTALFDAASGGNMAHEVLFTPRTLATNDVLTITLGITLT